MTPSMDCNEKTPNELRDEFWAADQRNGSIIRSQYDEIKRVLAERDFAWVEEQYSRLKQHAIDYTVYYKDYTVNDAFPVMNKMLLIENQEQCSAKGNYQIPLHISSTSGSTGTPFSVIQDYKKRNRNIADLKVFGELCDYPSHERMIFFRVISEKLIRTPEQEARENIFYIDSSNFDDAHLEQMTHAVLEKKPRILLSYSSTLVELAKYIEKRKEGKTFSMSSVLVGGEGISDENRELLERVFGCTVYRRYSNQEMGILGQDTGNGSSYRLNWGSYYFEVLKIDSDEPAKTGEVGRIVVTDLFNYAFPMIRYDTGDLGVAESVEGGFMRLREIYGRSRDCVYTVDGSLLSPAKISVMMWGVSGVKQWQFIQETESDYILKLNCSGDVDTASLVSRYSDLLGGGNVAVEFVDEIPVTSSNKRRAVICNLKK